MHERLEMNDVLAFTKYTVISREETLRRPSTNELEANAHDEIISLLGAGFRETPEKCRADAGYRLGNSDACLGIQTKSATFKKNGTTLNIFHSTSGYNGMLLFCRPIMTRVYIGTVIIPGDQAPTNLSVTLSPGSKYMPFLVPDTELRRFMETLYIAVGRGAKNYKWPSGNDVDISSLSLTSFPSLCSPTFAPNIRERDSDEWRRTVLPHLTYETPRVQGTTGRV